MAADVCSNPTTAPKQFEFVSGAACLDFANTVGGTREGEGRARECLGAYADLVSWCQQAEIVDGPGAEAMLRAAARRPEEAVATFRRAIGLRETIYRIFKSVAAGQSPGASDIEALNGELALSLGRLRLVLRKKGFDWTWADAANALETPLGPVARSAAELLTSREVLDRIRQCEGDGCGWLFIDSTKNHSRRWCVMKDCGNTAKVRRFRLRKQRQKKSGKARPA